MKKHFYSEHITTDSLRKALEELPMETHEREELHTLIESSLHHAILDAVLSQLPEEDKKTFLLHITKENHTVTWDFLKERIENIDIVIKQTGESILTSFHADIQELKIKT